MKLKTIACVLGMLLLAGCLHGCGAGINGNGAQAWLGSPSATPRATYNTTAADITLVEIGIGVAQATGAIPAADNKKISDAELAIATTMSDASKWLTDNPQLADQPGAINPKLNAATLALAVLRIQLPAPIPPSVPSTTAPATLPTTQP